MYLSFIYYFNKDILIYVCLIFIHISSIFVVFISVVSLIVCLQCRHVCDYFKTISDDYHLHFVSFTTIAVVLFSLTVKPLNCASLKFSIFIFKIIFTPIMFWRFQILRCLFAVLICNVAASFN